MKMHELKSEVHVMWSNNGFQFSFHFLKIDALSKVIRSILIVSGATLHKPACLAKTAVFTTFHSLWSPKMLEFFCQTKRNNTCSSIRVDKQSHLESESLVYFDTED